jgi:ribosome-associated toxin RatA of RatAB toxin-antitoxin module
MPAFVDSLTSPAPTGPSGGGEVVVERLSLGPQRRRLLATVIIPRPVEQVWRVLTDYDNLASFIPNLSFSRQLPHPNGGLRLEQVGSRCFLNLRFCARVVLDMVEDYPHRLSFAMVEGDFRQFEGQWGLEPAAHGEATQLTYDLVISPPLAMPISLIAAHLCQDLTANLRAIRDRTLASPSTLP